MKLRSATGILLPKTYEIIWRRGEMYLEQGFVKVAKRDDREIRALVRGSEEYTVVLVFSGAGLKRRCTCPYASGGMVCKHMVAVALLWDEKRHLNVPTDEEIEDNTIAEPAVSRHDVDAAFADPLGADLEVVRMAASELSRSARSHSRLPLSPILTWGKSAPVTRVEAKKAFQTIARWTKRADFDPYFCAGEMVGAFCETLRRIARRAPASNPLVLANILLDAQRAHFKIVGELIDDSDGWHAFSEVHLDELRDIIKGMKCKKEDKSSLDELLWNYDAHRDDY